MSRTHGLLGLYWHYFVLHGVLLYDSLIRLMYCIWSGLCPVLHLVHLMSYHWSIHVLLLIHPVPRGCTACCAFGPHVVQHLVHPMSCAWSTQIPGSWPTLCPAFGPPTSCSYYVLRLDDSMLSLCPAFDPSLQCAWPAHVLHLVRIWFQSAPCPAAAFDPPHALHLVHYMSCRWSALCHVLGLAYIQHLCTLCPPCGQHYAPSLV